MGGGTTRILILYLCGTFFSVSASCVKSDLCKGAKTGFETTFSTLGDQINITVKMETEDFYILQRNSCILFTKSNQPSNVKVNSTHFTLALPCSTSIGNYVLQTASYSSTCYYFNVTNCPSDSTSTHLAQKSCSECKYTIFTITPFVIFLFYFIF
nr:membrane glycoprotein E51 [Elephant endotheliotropic herpesvirus 1A]